MRSITTAVETLRTDRGGMLIDHRDDDTTERRERIREVFNEVGDLPEGRRGNEHRFRRPVRIWVTRISGVVIGLSLLWLVGMLLLAVWARPKLLVGFRPALGYLKDQTAIQFIGYEDGVRIVDEGDGRLMLPVQSIEGKTQGFLVSRQSLGLVEESLLVGIAFVLAPLGHSAFQFGFCNLDGERRPEDFELLIKECDSVSERLPAFMAPTLIDLGRKGKRLGDLDSFILHTLPGRDCDIWFDTIFFFDYTRSAHFVRPWSPYQPGA